MVVNFPNADWPIDLNPVEGICGRSLFAQQKIFLSAVFSNKFFTLEADTFKTYNSKGVCSVALKFRQQLD